MMLNSIAFWMVAFMIKDGGLFMGAGGEGEGFKLPKSLYAPQILGGPYTILLALALAGFLYFMFARTKIGLSNQGVRSQSIRGQICRDKSI